MERGGNIGYLSKTHLRLKSLRPRQNGRRFADDTFKRLFFNENVRISIKISLKFLSKGPIYNNPALVQIMAWRRSGDKPLSEPMMFSLLTHICVTRPWWVNSLITYFPVTQSLWNFAQSTAVILCCSVQKFKVNGTTKKDVMDVWNFVVSEIKLSFRQISYIIQHNKLVISVDY